MNTLDAIEIGKANRGKELMVFDWNKAAQIIKEHGAKYASAGLQNDWEWTGGEIWMNNAPVPEDDTYVFLASTWAIPELNVDGDVIECYIMEHDVPSDWGADDRAKIYWPESALKIVNS